MEKRPGWRIGRDWPCRGREKREREEPDRLLQCRTMAFCTGTNPAVHALLEASEAAQRKGRDRGGQLRASRSALVCLLLRALAGHWLDFWAGAVVGSSVFSAFPSFRLLTFFSFLFFPFFSLSSASLPLSSTLFLLHRDNAAVTPCLGLNPTFQSLSRYRLNRNPHHSAPQSRSVLVLHPLSHRNLPNPLSVLMS